MIKFVLRHNVNRTSICGLLGFKFYIVDLHDNPSNSSGMIKELMKHMS